MQLDALLREARRRFVDRHPQEQQIALEKLWDAWERLKTLEPGRDTKARADALLDRAGTGVWPEYLGAEADALNKIGNNLAIRHFNHRTTPVPEAAVDYLFTRLGSFMLYLLRVTDRLT